MRGAGGVLAVLLALVAGLAGAGSLLAATHVVRGTDRATMLIPAGVQVESYSNSGYRVEVADSVAQVEVDLAPLESRQRLRRALAARGAQSRGPARARRHRRCQDPVRGGVADSRLDLRQRSLRARSLEAQDSRSVLTRRSAFCTGTARLSVALLDALAIPAREDCRVRRGGAARGPWLRLPSLDRGLLRRSRLGLLRSAGEPELRRRHLPSARFERSRERAARRGAPALARQPDRGDRRPGADAGPTRARARQRRRAAYARRCG